MGDTDNHEPPASDALQSDALATPPIAHVSAFGATYTTSSATTFEVTPNAAGDAFALFVTCTGPLASTQPPTVVTNDWHWSSLGSWIAGPTETYAGSFGALAPNADMATVIVMFPSGSCEISVLVDEFGPVGSGGPLGFDTYLDASADDPCAGTLAPGRDDDAIWAACVAGAPLKGPGSGYTEGSNDGTTAISEYRLTLDPANTQETAAFDVSPSLYVVSMVAIDRVPL
jgi:hypothetical protein